jgi:hypothetical protein
MRLSSFKPTRQLRLSTVWNIGNPEILSQFELIALAVAYRPRAAANSAPLGAGVAIIVVAACEYRGCPCASTEYLHLYSRCGSVGQIADFAQLVGEHEVPRSHVGLGLLLPGHLLAAGGGDADCVGRLVGLGSTLIN